MMPGQMHGGMAMPVEQSNKDMMAALMDTKDTSMAASIMKTAGLDRIMRTEGMDTLFVASDMALKAESPDTLNRMRENLKDRQMATEFVKGHMVSGMITPDKMTDGEKLTMMNGMTMEVRKTDGRMMVDDANIVKAIKTKNGIIYVMDRIPSSIMTLVEQQGMSSMSDMPSSR
ncbi:fasciclin domain-containing protein [Methanocella paludicola]|nr:fasciclin domain-containing protein [Methanocella paludicola]